MSSGVQIPMGPISGFPEWTPAERIAELSMLDTIRDGFERFGFLPIETPAVERNDVLTAKSSGETVRQIYSLSRLTADVDDTTTDVSLHFDLTVPLARYVAQRYGELTFPFRRYQMQKVWRGERPQEGRFREFYQCDIDIIGDGSLSLMADAEIPAVIVDVFSSLNIGRFMIRVSNRKILGGYFTYLGIPSDRIMNVLREVDKLERQGIDAVLRGLGKSGLNRKAAEDIISFVTKAGTKEEVVGYLSSLTVNGEFEAGIEELGTVVKYADSFGIPAENFSVDLSIARGLDYYTGTVYETTLVDHPGIGSVCSGGRFDDLAGLFIGRKLPGVGISIGLTRLFSRLKSAGLVKVDKATVAPVMVATPEPGDMPRYVDVATKIRQSGINAELYLETGNLGKQMRYASKKGFEVVAIPLNSENGETVVRLRDMRNGNEKEVGSQQLTRELTRILGRHKIKRKSES